jgi:two-component system, NarL family, sensor histidine kinase DesK
MSGSTLWRLLSRHLTDGERKDALLPGITLSPRGRRAAMVKLLWVGIWFAYLAPPVQDLAGDRHGPLGTAAGWAGLVAFVGTYLLLVFRNTTRGVARPWIAWALLALAALAVTLSLTLGSPWLVLFVYLSVTLAAVLPSRTARAAVPAAAVLLAVVGAPMAGAGDLVASLVVPTLLGGFAMVGVREMMRTTLALREARATVAQLAANEERLRLARDLHDLLGHSLSLITLKSELAGRMLPGDAEQAARQVADIERVSRQALVDVREAVSGFRRPTLEAEAAGARTALAAAGVHGDLTRLGAVPADLSAEREGALAWALREAVTNVVRHSGAQTCAVSLAAAGEEFCLTVTDDGHGPGGEPGHGLTGLAERLALADGRLETGPAARRGFALRAYVPRSHAPSAPRSEAAPPAA